MSQQAFKFVATITPNEKIDIEVLILSPPDDNFADLVGAAASSVDFWDIALDDEDWNNGSRFMAETDTYCSGFLCL